MKWHATHILKVKGGAPRRVMKTSDGGLHTAGEWERCEAPMYLLDEHDRVLFDNGLSTNPVPASASVTPLESVKKGESITPLRSTGVTRMTQTQVRRGGKMRRVVVTLLPGDVIEMREEGCRDRRSLSVMDAWGMAGKLKAQALRAARKLKRKQGRKS